MAVLAALAGAGAQAEAAAFKITLIIQQDNPDLDSARRQSAYLGHPGGPASDGLNVALEESRFELDAAGAQLALDTVEVATAEAARTAAQKAEKAGVVAIVTDLPPAATLAVADAVKLPVLNVGSEADSLRQADCRPRLFHIAPSARMRSDALAQTLVSRKWQQALLLVGPSPLDAQRAAVAQASMKRYGVQVVATRPFKISGDPRERDLANPLLLTGKASYDVVWVVDSDGEFGRQLPYRTALPRPVVGDGGMFALAWHAQYERFGAPQVSKRFAKELKRSMTSQDWLAWLAGKALAGAAVAAPKGPPAAMAKALIEGTIDGSKGVVMSFRPWDGQLRQPMLLTDGQGVISAAPIDGILHPKNNLDTLGADAPEKLCKARS